MLWKSAKPQAALVRLVGAQQVEEGLGLEWFRAYLDFPLTHNTVMALSPNILGRWASSVAIWEVHVAQFWKP